MKQETDKKIELVHLLHDLKSKNTAVSVMADTAIGELVEECGRDTVDKWVDELGALFKLQKPKNMMEAIQLVRNNNS